MRALAAAKREALENNADFAAEHAYYAMFYAAEALLAERGLFFRSHGAVHGAFGMHFAKSGELDPAYHRYLLDAFETRQVATYNLDLEIIEQQVQELIGYAEEFVNAARLYLDQIPEAALFRTNSFTVCFAG